jgi:Co/Zn/Cd efflux system component
MHRHTLDDFRHEHVFLGRRHDRNERRTWLVVSLTAAMMVGKIAGGTIFGSMALVADGWHMLTHAGALTIAALAYRFARRHAHDDRFTFGAGKLGEVVRSIVSNTPQAPEAYRVRLYRIEGLSHITVQVHAYGHDRVKLRSAPAHDR